MIFCTEFSHLTLML